MKNSTILLSLIAATTLTTSLRAGDQLWQRQQATQRWAAECAQTTRLERAPSVALFVHNSGVGESSSSRDARQRATMDHQGRYPRSFYHSTPQDPRSDY